MTPGLDILFKGQSQSVFTQSRPTVGSSVEQWCSGNEVIVCVRGDKGCFNLAPFTPMRWGPNHILVFSTPLFSFCEPSAWNCLCWSWQSRFHTDIRPLSKSEHPWPTSLRLFWLCNLSLFWSSVVPTQEWSAQRKKLMKLSFPLKCGSRAPPVSTLSGWCFWVSHSHHRVSLYRRQGVCEGPSWCVSACYSPFLQSITLYVNFLPSRLPVFWSKIYCGNASVSRDCFKNSPWWCSPVENSSSSAPY